MSTPPLSISYACLIRSTKMLAIIHSVREKPFPVKGVCDFLLFVDLPIHVLGCLIQPWIQLVR